jgi:hypothetical protein
VLLGSCEDLGHTLCNRAVDLVGPQPAPRNVIPLNEARRAAVRKPDFEAPAQRHGLVLDDADAVAHVKEQLRVNFARFGFGQAVAFFVAGRQGRWSIGWGCRTQKP